MRHRHCEGQYQPRALGAAATSLQQGLAAGRGLWAGLSVGVVPALSAASTTPRGHARYAGRGPAGRGGPMLVPMLGGPGID